MADVLNPLTFLGDLAEFYANAARETGIAAMDPALCLAFAEGLGEACATMQALLTLCTERGLVECSTVDLDEPHPPLDRADLVLEAVAAADGNVMPFPRADRVRSAFAGGSAA